MFSWSFIPSNWSLGSFFILHLPPQPSLRPRKQDFNVPGLIVFGGVKVGKRENREKASGSSGSHPQHRDFLFLAGFLLQHRIQLLPERLQVALELVLREEDRAQAPQIWGILVSQISLVLFPSPTPHPGWKQTPRHLIHPQPTPFSCLLEHFRRLSPQKRWNQPFPVLNWPLPIPNWGVRSVLPPQIPLFFPLPSHQTGPAGPFQCCPWNPPCPPRIPRVPNPTSMSKSTSPGSRTRLGSEQGLARGSFRGSPGGTPKMRGWGGPQKWGVFWGGTPKMRGLGGA